jgi:hypothetical protein
MRRFLRRLFTPWRLVAELEARVEDLSRQNTLIVAAKVEEARRLEKKYRDLELEWSEAKREHQKRKFSHDQMAGKHAVAIARANRLEEDNRELREINWKYKQRIHELEDLAALAE